MSLHKRIAIGSLLLATAMAATYVAVRPRPLPESGAPARIDGVEFAGCAGVRVGPICEITEDTTLVIWLPGNERLHAWTDLGESSLEAPEILSGGTSHRVRVPHGAKWLTLETESAPRRNWKLTLDSVKAPAVLSRAQKLRQAGKLDEAEHELTRELEAAPPELRARIQGALARLALARGRIDAAAATFRESIAAAERAGRASDAVLDSVACAFTLTTRTHRLSEARQLLERARRWSGDYHEASAKLPYYRGAVALHGADLGQALREFRSAEARAERLGMERLRRDATEAIALVLSDLGRSDEALTLQRSLLKGLDQEPPCEAQGVQLNLSWMLLRSSDAQSLGMARRHARDAIDGLDQRCVDPHSRKNAHLTSAAAALRAGDLSAARTQLDLARGIASDGADLKLWEIDLEGELALADARPKHAHASFLREAELAARVGASDALWRTRTGLGSALSAEGRNARAIEVLTEAESLLDQLLFAVPLSQGRDTFLTERDTSARRLVRLHLKAGNPERALEVARRARTRMLVTLANRDRLAAMSDAERRRWDDAMGRYHQLRRQLEQEASSEWSLTVDQLRVAKSKHRARLRELDAALDDAHSLLVGPAPGILASADAQEPGSARLTYFPTDRGWVGFFQTRAELRVRELGELSGDSRLARFALEPFSDLLDDIESLVVLSYGPLRRVDFHGASHRGKPLLSQLRLTYALDLPQSRATDDAPIGSWLIVADARGDLPYARREAEIVRTARREARMLVGAEATRAAVLRLLPDADLFHYAGHASFAGPSGSQSALLLAEQQKLLLGDVLALGRAPRAVVLSACDAAQTTWYAAPETMSLAHAFIARGARVVVAPTRPVADDLAEQLMRALYRTRGVALPEALRRAQLELSRSRPGSDWAAYRVLTP